MTHQSGVYRSKSVSKVILTYKPLERSWNGWRPLAHILGMLGFWKRVKSKIDKVLGNFLPFTPWSVSFQSNS